MIGLKGNESQPQKLAKIARLPFCTPHIITPTKDIMSLVRLIQSTVIYGVILLSVKLCITRLINAP